MALKIGKHKTASVPVTRQPATTSVRTQRPAVAVGASRSGEIIGVDVLASTSLGTGTTKTLITGANYVLPAWAKSIKRVGIAITESVPTATQSVSAKAILESDDFNIGPCELLAAPLGAILGATNSPTYQGRQWYELNCPVDGGQLKAYGQALVNNTVAPTMDIAIEISNMPPSGKQKFGKVGTLTTTGTTATTDVAGTSYNFTKGSRITELCGMVLPTTVAAADDIAGHIKFSSSEFGEAMPTKLPLEPIPGGLGALICANISLSRQPISIPLRGGQTNIQDYLYMDVAPGTAGNWVSGVVFE